MVVVCVDARDLCTPATGVAAGSKLSGDMVDDADNVEHAATTTDDNGITSNFNDARIRETVGFLLGYAQFAEQ